VRMTASMKITVLGAGAWGTALAAVAARRHDVMLWGRDPEHMKQLRATRCNPRYLRDSMLPASLALSYDLAQAVEHVVDVRRPKDSLVVVATPMAALREMLGAVGPDVQVLWLCKGFEQGTGALGHEIATEVRPHASAAALSGPSFASEVARGQPTALVAASRDEALRSAATRAFHHDATRIYTSDDIVGVEVGGAVKNVLAIATGLCDGLGERPQVDVPRPGLNARAALVTRGLAEMTRLGVAMGARAETFMGLSGLGDLVLTSTGALSRNRRVGVRLAQGLGLPQVLAELGHVSEGVYSAATVLERARTLGIEMPITEAVVEVLEGRLAPAECVRGLMSREAKAE
jgi:glycerol-3-phosphate dehydrogenase (NAD(P)+)